MSTCQMAWIMSSMALGMPDVADCGNGCRPPLCRTEGACRSESGCAVSSGYCSPCDEPAVRLHRAPGSHAVLYADLGIDQRHRDGARPSEKFAQIRVFGSIGWVAWPPFSVWWPAKASASAIDGFDTSSLPMLCGAGVGVAGALLALTLPNTPPPGQGQEGFSCSTPWACGRSSLMKDFQFAIFIICYACDDSLCSVFHFGSALPQGQEIRVHHDHDESGASSPRCSSCCCAARNCQCRFAVDHDLWPGRC